MLRWKLDRCEPIMEMDKDGDYVEYVDAMKEIDELRTALEASRKVAEIQKAQIDALEAEVSQWSFLGDSAATELVQIKLKVVPELQKENKILKCANNLLEGRIEKLELDMQLVMGESRRLKDVRGNLLEKNKELTEMLKWCSPFTDYNENEVEICCWCKMSHDTHKPDCEYVAMIKED